MRPTRTVKSSRPMRSLLPTFVLLAALLLAMLPAGLLAAPALQSDDEPLYFVSDTMPAASSPGRIITLTVNPDNTATLTTDFLNDEDPVVEEGTWLSDEATQSIEVTLTSGPSGVYTTPEVLTFAVDDEGTLTLDAENSTASFGSAGLVLYFSEDGSQVVNTAETAATGTTTTGPATTGPATTETAATGDSADNPADEADPSFDAADELEDPSGVYVSNILPSADTPGQVVFMILYPDGVLQADTYYLNQEPPISETGTWTMTEESDVVVTILGTDEADYDEPQELTFAYDVFSLTYLSLTLNRVVEQRMTAEPIAWYTTGILPAASSPGLQMSLILYDDGSATMVNDYMNGEDPIIEVGEWEAGADGTLTVTLTGQVDGVYETPDVIVFSEEDGVLTAIEKDESIYGNNDLVFTEQSLEDLPEEDVLPVGEDDAEEEEDVTGSEALTGTTAVTGTDAVTTTATPTVTGTTTGTATGSTTGTVTTTVTTTPAATTGGTQDLSSLLSDELANFPTPIGATAAFVSGFMPSASTPGRVVALILYRDGTAEMLTDYLTGDSPYSEVGTWEEDADGNIAVALTGPAGQPYDTAVEILFAPTATGLEAVEYDQSVYGSEGLTLNEVE